jgi:RHS repeat-associated protein
MQGIDEPLVGQRQPQIFYYEADGLGSVTSLTTPTGSTAATYTYDSFGFLTASTGSATNWYRYTARQFDSDTALYYNRARYYDPTTGRFLSEDPVGFKGSGTNFYAYVRNSPIDFTDPSGLCPNQTPQQKGPTVPPNPCQYQGRALSPSDYATMGKNAPWYSLNFDLDVHYGWGSGQYFGCAAFNQHPRNLECSRLRKLCIWRLYASRRCAPLGCPARSRVVCTQKDLSERDANAAGLPRPPGGQRPKHHEWV